MKVYNGLSVVLGVMHAILVILGLVATFLAVVSHGDLVPALVEADGRYISWNGLFPIFYLNGM